MPSTKPASTPRWATNGGTTTSPSSGQQDTGWTVNQVPPSQVENWLKNLTYQWTAYLNDYEAHALTWTANQHFADDITVDGQANINSLNVTGNGQVTGTFGVTGGTTLTGALNAGNASFVDITHVHDLTVVNSLVGTGCTANFDSVTTSALSTFWKIAATNPGHTPVIPSVAAGCTMPASTAPKLGYWIDLQGVLHISGSVAFSPAVGTSGVTVWAAGTVPVAYRPTVGSGATRICVAEDSSSHWTTAYVGIRQDGSLFVAQLTSLSVTLVSAELDCCFNPFIV